ncbi:MFS transporter, partial [Streptomyces sp. SID2955]|nr:MFS transporter [Streptomyces sp. SID2955]
VTFFDVLEGAGPGTAPAAAFTDAFVNSLWWVVGGLGIAFLLMLALPRLSPPPAGMMPAADEGEAPVTA